MLHKDLAKGDWSKFSVTQQLANVGAEFQRVLNWEKKGNREYEQAARARLLELLDMTIATQKPSRLGELTSLKEAVLNKAFRNELQNYFLQYAQAARK